LYYILLALGEIPKEENHSGSLILYKITYGTEYAIILSFKANRLYPLPRVFHNITGLEHSTRELASVLLPACQMAYPPIKVMAYFASCTDMMLVWKRGGWHTLPIDVLLTGRKKEEHKLELLKIKSKLDRADLPRTKNNMVSKYLPSTP
jgi:hypothetical protein